MFPCGWVYFRVAFRLPSVECGNSESSNEDYTTDDSFFDDAPEDSEDVAFGDLEDVTLGDCVFEDPPEDSEDVVDLSVSTLELKERGSSTP